MKKRKFLFCTILSLILLCANLPIASAALTTVEATYDNSVKISLRSPYETFQETEAYLPYYGEEGIDYRLVKKESFSTEFRYEFLAVTEPDLLENLKAKFSKPGIGKSPNIYAKDYNERTSVLTLSANTLEIPVGETATIQIDKCELLTSVFNEEGVVVELDPQVISYEEFQEFVQEQFQQGGNYLATYTLYEEDYHYQNDKYENGHLMFENYIERAFTNQDQVQRENVQSPVNRYAVAFAFANFEQTVEPIANLEGVLSVEPFYTHALTGMPPHEKWSVENGEIASITVQSENPYGLDSVVTVTANKVGKTALTLCRGGGSVSLSRTCTITVVEPDSNTQPPDIPVTDTNVTPTDILYGDVNGDEKIEAKDALWVLKYCVGKQALTPNQLQAADFSFQVYKTENHKGIDAKDALVILQFVCHTGPFHHDFLTAVSYTDYDVQTRYDYSWEVNPLKSYPDTLCRSLEELIAYLAENNLPEEWATSYSEEYFETKSLLLFDGFEPCRGSLWTVSSITKSLDALDVKVVYHSLSMIDVAASHLYHVEIDDPLNEIKRGYITRVSYYQNAVKGYISVG